MPIYEYQCESCGKVFEVMQKLSDPPVKSCKLCKGRKVRKLLAAPALQFKGSGWYITDYAGKNAANNTESKPGKSESKAETPSSAPACACKSGSCGSK
jgi:putative FmdB family regulatory protein